MDSDQNAVMNNLRRKIMDKTFLPRKKVMKYNCLSKETKFQLQKLFEKVCLFIELKILSINSIFRIPS